jgi:hypothetical protein
MGFMEIQRLETLRIISPLPLTPIIRSISIHYKTKINPLKSSPILMITTTTTILFMMAIKKPIIPMEAGEVIILTPA